MNFSKLARANKESNPEAYNAYRSYLIEKMVEKRYSPKQEIAILRQRDTKPDEYKAYFDYVEQCKAEVNDILSK